MLLLVEGVARFFQQKTSPGSYIAYTEDMKALDNRLREWTQTINLS